MSELISQLNGRLYFRGYEEKGIIMKFFYLLIIFLSYSCEQEIENLIKENKEEKAVEREYPVLICNEGILGHMQRYSHQIELSESEYDRVKEEYELYVESDKLFIKRDSDGNLDRVNNISFSDEFFTIIVNVSSEAYSTFTAKELERILVDDTDEILLPELEIIEDRSSKYTFYFREVL